MPKKITNEMTPSLSKEQIKDTLAFAQTYYLHQYQRFATHEQQQLTLSNIVIGVSTIAFTFGFSGSQSVNLLNGVGLPIIVITINIYAILYYRKTGEFIKTHRKRAKRVLKDYAEPVYNIDQEIKWEGPSPDWRFFSAIHVFMILVTLLPISLYLQTFP
jgi:hypothetical protein